MLFFNKTKQSQYYNLNSNIPFYYLHIPKTAGTTFISYLDEILSVKKMFYHQVWNHLTPADKNLSQYNYFRGHFGYGLLRHLKTKPILVTILRKPIGRSISMLSHMKQDPVYNNWVPVNFLDGFININKVFFDPDKAKVFENTQTRYLGMDLDIPKIVSQKYHNDYKKILFDSENEFVNPKVPYSELFEKAKNNLQEFQFVGLKEYFSESLSLFAYTFNIKPFLGERFYLQNWTKKPDITELNSPIMKRIYELNRFDIKLYDYAKKIFSKRYKDMLEELQKTYYHEEYSGLNETECVYFMLRERFEKLNK